MQIDRIDGVTVLTDIIRRDDWASGGFLPKHQRYPFCSGFGGCRPDWFGSSSMDDLKREVSGDWPVGFDKIDRNIKALDIPRLTSVRRTQVWADAGDEVSMDKVWSGNLDTAWRTTRRMSRSVPPSFRVILNSSIAGCMDADILFWRGAVAIKLIETLCEAGYNVEAVSLCPSLPGVGKIRDPKYKNTTWLHEVKVKDFQAPFDRGLCGIALAHPGFTRAGLYAQNFQVYAPYITSTSGLGSAKDIEPEHIKAMGYETGNTRNFVLSGDEHFQSAAAANEFLKTLLEGLS